jgi:hypothetical protein
MYSGVIYKTIFKKQNNSDDISFYLTLASGVILALSAWF